MLKWATGAAAWTLRDGGWWQWLFAFGGGAAFGLGSTHAWSSAAGAVVGATAGLLLAKAGASLLGGEAPGASPAGGRLATPAVRTCVVGLRRLHEAAR